MPLLTSFGAAIAGLALSHTIAKSIIYGLFTKTIPFFRTPKMANQSGFMIALAEAREELFLLLLLWGAAGCMLWLHNMESMDAWAWLYMLLVQSLAYLAAVFMAFLSVIPQKAEKTAEDNIPEPQAVS